MRSFFQWSYIIKASAVMVLLLLCGCAGTANVHSLTENDNDYGASDTEISLLNKSAEAHKTLENKGMILTDGEVNAFVRQTGARIMPPLYGTNVNIQFYVLKDSTVNAMAFPNGNIYINVGLLAKLGNESQLAHILAHEVAHVVQRHSLKSAINRSSTMIAAHITDLLLFGTSIGYLPYIGSLSGFSQDQELEADKLALQYMSDANYDVNESVKVFKILQSVSAIDSIKGSIYSSHPTNQLRITQSQNLIRQQYANGTNASLDEAQFKLVSRHLERLNLRLQLTSKKYQMTIDGADKAIANHSDDPWIWYYKAEAYRLSAKYPKSAARERYWIKGNGKSIEEYEQEIQAQSQELLNNAIDALSQGEQRVGDIPQYHRCRGLIAYQSGDLELARKELTKYLDSDSELKDRLFIERQLQKIGG